MRPLYDEPEFVVRNIWRLYGGWWDGAASRLKPSPDAHLAAAVAELAGGADVLIRRADKAASEGDRRLAATSPTSPAGPRRTIPASTRGGRGSSWPAGRRNRA
ncbi:MAG: alkyl sulfatase dimerization domain-containing protein [Actinomycetota bacterium]